jgi:DNA-nicking Smr family endonuclease
VPHWLNESDLRLLVVGVQSAHRRHGGSGALYVYLRRRRKR